MDWQLVSNFSPTKTRIGSCHKTESLFTNAHLVSSGTLTEPLWRALIILRVGNHLLPVSHNVYARIEQQRCSGYRNQRVIETLSGCSGSGV